MQKDDVSFYNYEINFFIENEKALNEFWSFLIFRINIKENESVYNQFARLYNILNDNHDNFSKDLSIKLKESRYFYNIKIKNPPFEFLKSIVYKLKQFNQEFSIDNNHIAFNYQKENYNIDLVKNDEKKHRVLSEDDLENLVNMIEKFLAYNYSLHYKSFEIDELHSYKSVFSNYSNVISEYEDLNVISNTVAELSVILSLYEDQCLYKGDMLRSLLEGFTKNLEIWHNSVFVYKNQKIDYLDDSFMADLKQLKVMLELFDDEPDEEIDMFDLFDL